MSLYDYRESIEMAKRDYGFYSLIMAAMRKADDVNLHRLKSMWPGTWLDLQQRYNSPDGFLVTNSNNSFDLGG